MSELCDISLEEQETHIHYMRGDKFATIYTTDRTTITRLDKLCESASGYYQLVKVDTIKGKICGKTYKLTDKSMVSLRAKKREFTEEQKKVMGERLKKNGVFG